MTTRASLFAIVLIAAAALCPTVCIAQTPIGSAADPLGKATPISPLTMPTLSPGEIELVKLEGEFSDAVARGGGKAFASYFAEDGITLQNGKPPVLGHAAIAVTAVWDPKDYQLSWYAEGAQMAPGGESGFTWGHYTATAKDKKGLPITLSGRYITFWKKVAGEWKVALDASADDVPGGGDCCVLPKP